MEGKVFVTGLSVRDAGRIISGPLPLAEGPIPDEIITAFRVANLWREAHAHPMQSIRAVLMSWLYRHGIHGVTGARLKRMPAIRKKLQRLDPKLDKLQDLGGCRVILPSMANLRTYSEILKEHLPHKPWKQDLYIDHPKGDGYRCNHFIYEFNDKAGRDRYQGRRIEIQVRTRLQHSWATAVEAVGLFRGEYLKGGQGNEDWRRLFKLISAEFAVAEGCPEAADVPAHEDRVREIVEIEQRLKAADILSSLATAVRSIDFYVQPSRKPDYYLIRYHAEARQVEVEPRYGRGAARAYFDVESINRAAGNEMNDVVLVAADKIDVLKQAYPNYFGDVTLFNSMLTKLVQRVPLSDFELKPQTKVRILPEERADMSWMRRTARWTSLTVPVANPRKSGATKRKKNK